MKSLAYRTQSDPLPLFHRQGGIQMALEDLHVLADGTDGYAQMLRSTGNTPAMSNRLEYLQCA
ncbi:hypothetical protein [Rhizobium sp. Pop5]|uniref:hypothetical protein n=1 Tax=Rhizobium sp. Pop5 TaxID=1223565 RepID=UPI001FD8A04A|nr:hypothetical protein [Rhizobium sp. Pop5]